MSISLAAAMACDGESEQAPTPLAETATASATVDTESTPTPLPPAREIVLDNQPRPPLAATPDALAGEPCEFGTWDPPSTIIYDTVTCETIDLGPTLASGGDGDDFGSRLAFSDDSKFVTWTRRDAATGSEYVETMELATRLRTTIEISVGSIFADFNDDGDIYVAYPLPAPWSIYHPDGTPIPSSPSPFPTRTVGPRSDESYDAPNGYRLFMAMVGPSYDSELRRIVVTSLDAAPLVEFTGSWAYPTGGDLVVATSPVNTIAIIPLT